MLEGGAPCSRTPSSTGIFIISKLARPSSTVLELHFRLFLQNRTNPSAAFKVCCWCPLDGPVAKRASAGLVRFWRNGCALEQCSRVPWSTDGARPSSTTLEHPPRAPCSRVEHRSQLSVQSNARARKRATFGKGLSRLGSRRAAIARQGRSSEGDRHGDFDGACEDAPLRRGRYPLNHYRSAAIQPRVLGRSCQQQAKIARRGGLFALDVHETSERS